MSRVNVLVFIKKVRNLVLFTIFLVAGIIPATVLYASNIKPAYVKANYEGTGIQNANGSIEGGKLAIIIDDFGQDRRGVKEMMSINRHLTFAVMPFLTYSKTDAETAHEKGYEVIVHLPLESNIGKLSWVGPRPIMVKMEKEEVRSIVMDAFENVPYAAGANIHMGSKASSDEQIISIILDIVKEKELFFVDSLTSEHSVTKKIADYRNVACLERNVFLDGSNKSKSYIKGQLEKAADLALKKGSAIAIGHVGIEGGIATAEAISEMLPEFDKKNIQLVSVSELLN